RKKQISGVGVFIGIVIYSVLFFLTWQYGTRINTFFFFIIPLLSIPIISSFISSYLTGNVYDGFIAVIITGIIIVLLYVSSFWGFFLKRLLNLAELDQNESLLLMVGGMGFFVVVLPIAYISLGGAFLGSKLAHYYTNKRIKQLEDL
ncbi:MAG: hypothetical protein ACFFFH_09555, partial [Candidatus Thorarchaeota archaeon]